MLPAYWMTKNCEECNCEYQGSQYDDDRCPRCELTHHVKRIADAIEYWVGMQ